MVGKGSEEKYFQVVHCHSQRRCLNGSIGFGETSCGGRRASTKIYLRPAHRAPMVGNGWIKDSTTMQGPRGEGGSRPCGWAGMPGIHMSDPVAAAENRIVGPVSALAIRKSTQWALAARSSGLRLHFSRNPGFVLAELLSQYSWSSRCDAIWEVCLENGRHTVTLRSALEVVNKCGSWLEVRCSTDSFAAGRGEGDKAKEEVVGAVRVVIVVVGLKIHIPRWTHAIFMDYSTCGNFA